MLHRYRPALTLVAALLVACEADSTEPRPDTPDPLVPEPGAVMSDIRGTLDAAADQWHLDHDTLVAGPVAGGHDMGVIAEADEAIVITGLGSSIPVPAGVEYAAMVEGFGSPTVPVQVRTLGVHDFAVAYRVRYIAVNRGTEHAGSALSIDGDFAREMTEGPLDIDVVTIELEEGDDFFLEMDTEGARVTARMRVPNSAVVWYPFLETGPALAQSAVFVAEADGTYTIEVHNVGLVPEVETTYRLRVRSVE